MKKAFSMMLIFVIVFFGIVFSLKFFIFKKESSISATFKNPIVTISAIKASESSWNSVINVVGSTRTVEGVNVTTELAGMIDEIDFTPGLNVKKNDVLVRLDIAPDVAKLHELQAQAALAKITFDRDQKQYRFGAVSKEQLDTDNANMLSTTASVEEQQATINKKIIRAPFSGRLGISAVNLGEFINSGQAVVSLQALNPIYVDFYLPQQEIQNAFVGQDVQVTTDRAPKEIFTGKITTINPIVNTDIRNVEVEATLPNCKEILLPGMFTNVSIHVGNSQLFITLPEAAITFNPYGALVYILKKTNQQKNHQAIYKAEQQFVETGAMRGNQTQVLKGLKVGELIVTSGQLKLKNGSLVMVNNNVVPPDNSNPTLPEE